MMKSSIEESQEVNRALLDEFKIQEDVEMYGQLPDCDEFRGFDISIETDSDATTIRTYEGFAKPPRLDLKSRLSSARTPEK